MNKSNGAQSDTPSDSSTHHQSSADPSKWSAIGLSTLFLITLPILMFVIVGADRTTAPSHSQSTNAEPLIEPSAFVSTKGEAIFKANCVTCHGPEANGIVKLGKPLRNSAFIQAQDDESIFQLISHGRAIDDPANTTGVLMPPRGLQQINDEQIHLVIAFLRSIQDPSQPTASVEAWIAPPPEPGAVVVDTSGLVGHDLFVSSCSACHGVNGEGMEGLGKPLNTSVFAASKSDKDLMTFIKTGRPMWDAANTTGVDMPPKGGNPAMSDDDLAQIIQFIRAIHKDS